MSNQVKLAATAVGESNVRPVADTILELPLRKRFSWNKSP